MAEVTIKNAAAIPSQQTISNAVVPEEASLSDFDSLNFKFDRNGARQEIRSGQLSKSEFRPETSSSPKSFEHIVRDLATTASDETARKRWFRR